MVLMKSFDHPLGFGMPDFLLPDPFGNKIGAKQSLGEKGLLIVFNCNHCPYAIAQWPRLVRLAQEARTLGINTIAINANIHPDYPDDAVDRMPATMEKLGIDFPYLVDESQEVAREFKAQCTPDPFLFDAAGRLVYHGRIDDNWQDENAVTSQELKAALQALADGKPIAEPQHPSMGCSIKWRE